MFVMLEHADKKGDCMVCSSQRGIDTRFCYFQLQKKSCGCCVNISSYECEDLELHFQYSTTCPRKYPAMPIKNNFFASLVESNLCDIAPL